MSLSAITTVSESTEIVLTLLAYLNLIGAIDQQHLKNSANLESTPNFQYPLGKTLWPLQKDNPGSRIKNLNDYLSLFSRCLVNIQNFQGIDLHEWKYPIFLTRIDIASAIFLNDRMSSTGQYFYNANPSLEVLNLNQTKRVYIKEIEPEDTIKFRWNCFAKFDIFYPELKDFPYYYKHFFNLNREENTLGPSEQYFETISDNPLPTVHGDNTRPTYFVLILNQNSTRYARDFWLYNNKGSLVNPHTENLFLLTVTNLSAAFQFLTHTELSIKHFSYFCFTWCKCKFVIIPLRLETWESQVQLLVELKGRIPWKIPGKDALVLFLSNENPTIRNFVSVRHAKKCTCLIKQ